MARAEPLRARVWRGCALAGVAAVGLLAIVGSGGGDVWRCFDYGPDCGGGPIPPGATVQPPRVTVEVGASVTFTATVASFATPRSYTLQWCLRPQGSDACAPIAGATSETYTLAGANLVDDGAQLGVAVTDANGTARAYGTLTVSSAPGLSFADGDFAPANWVATAVASPAVDGPTQSESQVGAGGDPGAYLSIGYLLPQAPSSIRVRHTWLGASYDPAAQGAIHVIDFSLSCARLAFDGANQAPYLAPTIEQGGRRYLPRVAAYAQSNWFCGPQWASLGPAVSVAATEFVLDDGPACGAAEACPDFSAQGGPIRFGFETSVELGAGYSTDSLVQGIDNWKVTVWRR